MKHKCIDKRNNDKNKYLNSLSIINIKKSRNLEKKRYQLYFQKCKNSSLKICNKMNKLCNICTVNESKC